MMIAPAAAIADRVHAVLDDLLGREQSRWQEVDPDLEAPVAALRSFVLSGGKRLRPAFCYWAFVGAGGNGDDPVIAAAGAALELLHAAALVHDDVIDGSATRHGADSLHVQFASRHRGQKWSGDADRFGEGVAVLVGDLALAYSARLLTGVPPAAAAVFDEIRIEVNIGQYLDVLGSTRQHDLTAPDAVERVGRICRYKTAKYTVEGPLHLGAALAGPERFPELAGPLSAFALPLGEAFQLRDDLLGVFGDPAATGKPVGDDLREGKLTLLVALAAARGTAQERQMLSERLGDGAMTADQVQQLQELMVATGAKADVEEAIDRLHEAAVDALARTPLERPALGALSELAAFATGRDH